MAKKIKPEGFFLALALVVGLIAVIIFRPMPTDAATPTTHWYKDWGQGGIDWSNESDVKELEDAIRWELYVGYADGKQIHSKIPGAYYGATLRLGNNITRGEFAVALGRCLDVGSDTDFPMGRVNPLQDKGIIIAEEADKDFSVPITRAEMAQWMGRAATAFKADTKDAVNFGDTNDRDILAAAGAGVIRGYPDGNFHPEDNAMRAHAALMLVRLSRSLNSDLPEDSELKEVIEQLAKSSTEMDELREKYGRWDSDIMSSVASDRLITSAQEAAEASGRIGLMSPNKLTLNGFKVLEKHNNIVLVWSSVMVNPLEGKPFEGTPEFDYIKKINGRWVVTGAVGTFEKY